MIRRFSEQKLNESENSYQKDLEEKISSLESENAKLVDEIEDLEESIEKKDFQIYGLEDDLHSLEKIVNKLENNVEFWEEEEQKWIEKKKEFKHLIEIFSDPWSTFNKGDEKDKLTIMETFIQFLEVMEDNPIVFSAILKKCLAKRKSELPNKYLNKEWVESYLNSGGGPLLYKFGIED
jgi:chromosome segregation ATPase